jgi:hypothetical protein
MREAGLRSFDTDDEMLVYLKKCIRFSAKSPSTHVKTTKVLAQLCQGLEEGESATDTTTKEVEEFEAVTLVLQAYGWQRSNNTGNDRNKPTFQRFPCSL